ncbi:MAG: sulfite exporter TauE/SafE family protein [Acutalibacteraceae bacterium]
MKLSKNLLFGGITGMLNGLLGAGGGMVAVPVLRKQMEIKESHATSIAIILPMSIASGISYILKGSVEISEALVYIPGGLIGAFVGIMLMKKIKPVVIKKIFAVVMLWAGFRMVTA